MNFDIAKDEGLEELVRQAQKHAHITSYQLGEKHNYPADSVDAIIHNIISQNAKSKLLAYNLIERDDKNNEVYNLTRKGLKFKSFKDEDEKAELISKKQAIDLANAERVYKTYKSTRRMAIASFIFSIILLCAALLKLLLDLKLWPFHK